jgi:putative two-component system response regulator
MSDDKIALIVDDVPANIDILKGMLSSEFKVKAALKGEKALSIAQRGPHPDLILLDVQMPEMDGYEVFGQLKANPQTARIPVIFVTGNDSQDQVSKGMALGAAGYLTKPVNADKLYSLIHKVLNNARSLD